ncbi:MAG: HlyD family efflux transporter periplasmic adaptor subunit [Armatimonadetes bacterium]|nr:HlyD family efflux transporter periplasmic adaptor subunit [Armatimonadota bacterium]
MKNWLHRRRNRWLLGLALVVGLLVLRSLRARIPEVEAAPAERGPLVLTIAASGKVDGVASDLAFDGTGTIAQLYVREGDQVSEGQPLARVESKIALGAVAPGADVLQAPYDGWVVAVLQREGVVAQQGQPVLRVVKRGSAWVTAYIDSEDAAYLSPGDKFVCRAGGYLARPWAVVVEAVGHEAVQREDVPGSARQVRVRMRLAETGFGLCVGTPVDVDGDVKMIDDALLIPAAAVVREGPSEYVWRLDGLKIHKAEIRTGANNFRQVVVQSGLEAGNQVVVSGKAKLKEGAVVRLKPTEPAGS